MLEAAAGIVGSKAGGSMGAALDNSIALTKQFDMSGGKHPAAAAGGSTGNGNVYLNAGSNNELQLLGGHKASIVS